MALRSGHGDGAGQPRIEVLPADELPECVAAPARKPKQAVPAGARLPNGRIADRQYASELARRGGYARAAQRGKLRTLETLGLRHVGGDLTAIAPFLADAEQFAIHEIERLAQTAGGGTCGAGPSSMVHSAALALAGSRFLYSSGDTTQIALASRLAESSRQHLAMAFELVAREAKARASSPGYVDPDVAAFMRGGTP